MDKVKIAKVVVVRGEGPSNECNKPKEFVGVDAMFDAQMQMQKWSYTAPKNGGYDKCDFTITFEDGYVYKGRYDLTGSGRDSDEDSIRTHVIRHVEFIAGKRRPSHLNDQQYAGIMKRYEHMKDDAVKFLEKASAGK